MWACDGKPLYTFVQDKKAGDVTGDMVGGVWHVAKGQ
jgi:predicted lipoprotein with Yx(FWY)xxD motif